MAWAGIGLAEAGEPAGGIDRDLPADGRRATAQQTLGLALGAQAEMLVPVEFQCGGQVVHLGKAEILGADTGLGVGGVEDLVLEHPLGRGHGCGGIRCDVRQFGQMLGVLRCLTG